MKNLKKNSLILLLITFIVLFFILKDDFGNIVSVLKNTNIFFLIIAISCYFVGVLFQALSYKEIINEYKYKYSLKKSYVMLIITKFFNGITPFSSGGQPLQIYLLNKEGIKLTKATNIIIQNFIIYQASLVTLGTFAIIVNYFNHMFTEVLILRQLVIIGFIINFIVMVILFIISFSSKFNNYIIGKIVSFFSSIHIIKNKEEILNKWTLRVSEFHEGTDFLKNNKMLCFRTYIYNIIGLSLIYVMPFFVLLAINSGDSLSLDPFKTICSSAYVLIMGSFVPIPGASGGIEYGFLEFFKNFVSGAILKTLLLIWRTISYYLPMIIGGILFSLHFKGDETK